MLSWSLILGWSTCQSIDNMEHDFGKIVYIITTITKHYYAHEALLSSMYMKH